MGIRDLAQRHGGRTISSLTRRQHHPALEALEPRLLLSSYLVNSLADVVMSDGVVTLREAIGAANSNTAVTADVVAGSATQVDNITFNQAALQIEAGPGNPLIITLNGTQLRISGDLNVQGLGEDVLSIDADGRSGVVYVSGGTTEVDLRGLTITGGSTRVHGGGIHNFYGTVRLTNSTVSGNWATESGSFGGGIYNGFGTVTLTDSTVSGNSAYWDGGGIYNKSGTVTLTDSTVSGNAAWDGAGILNYGNSTLTLVNSTVSDNWIDGTDGSGGGIFNHDSAMTLTNSTVSDNWADLAGGGIENWAGTVTLTNSTVSGNWAFFGGGIDSSLGGTMTLTNSTVVGNLAYEAGGIYNDESTLTLTNSTVSGNSADEDGGGIYNDAGTVTLNNTIVALNDAPISADIDGIFTKNSSLVGVDPGFVRNPSPGGDGVWGTSDDDYGDLRLGPTSPAINAGNNALLPADKFDLDGDLNVAEPLPLDLANGPRVVGGLVDIGAYELQASDAPDTPDLADGSDTGIPGDDITNLDNDAGRTLGFDVSGTVAGATVTIYADGTAIGSNTATGTTTTVTTDGDYDLTDGTHLITARQTEPYKLESAPSGPLEVTVETVPPTVEQVTSDTSGDVHIEFSEPVALLSINDIGITDDGGGPVDLEGVDLLHEPGSASAVLVGLADGSYILTLNGESIQDLSANLLAGELVYLLEISTTLTWDGEDPADWTSTHWNPGQVACSGGEAMVVDFGTVIVSSDLTAMPAASLDIAPPDAPGGTVNIGAAGTLVVEGEVNVGVGGRLHVDGTLVVSSPTPVPITIGMLSGSGKIVGGVSTVTINSIDPGNSVSMVTVGVTYRYQNNDASDITYPVLPPPSPPISAAASGEAMLAALFDRAAAGYLVQQAEAIDVAPNALGGYGSIATADGQATVPTAASAEPSPQVVFMPVVPLVAAGQKPPPTRTDPPAKTAELEPSLDTDLADILDKQLDPALPGR